MPLSLSTLRGLLTPKVHFSEQESVLTLYPFLSVLFLFVPVQITIRTQDDCAFTHAEILGLKLLFALMDQVHKHSIIVRLMVGVCFRLVLLSLDYHCVAVLSTLFCRFQCCFVGGAGFFCTLFTVVELYAAVTMQFFGLGCKGFV